MTRPHDPMLEPDPDALRALADAVGGLRHELRSVRKTQLKMYRAITDLRHELGHRLGGTREELGALLKASHADLAERVDSVDSLLDGQRQRFEELERDLDEFLDTHS